MSADTKRPPSTYSNPAAPPQERIAQLIAHRACTGTEHDPANGKLHGYCVVCGVPWPCSYAGAPAEPVALEEVAREITDELNKRLLLVQIPYRGGTNSENLNEIRRITLAIRRSRVGAEEPCDLNSLSDKELLKLRQFHEKKVDEIMRIAATVGRLLARNDDPAAPPTGEGQPQDRYDELQRAGCLVGCYWNTLDSPNQFFEHEDDCPNKVGTDGIEANPPKVEEIVSKFIKEQGWQDYDEGLPEALADLLRPFITPVSQPPTDDKRAENAFDKLAEQGFFEDVKDWPKGSRDECMEILRALAAPVTPVSPAEDLHPEDSCADCGRPNITWHAPSPVWNLVMRHGGPEPIVCPMCFAKRAEKHGLESWQLRPDPILYQEFTNGQCQKETHQSATSAQSESQTAESVLSSEPQQTATERAKNTSTTLTPVSGNGPGPKEKA